MNATTSYINYAGLLEFMHLNHNSTDLYLSHCGIQQCKPGHSYGRKPRPEYHLHFILDGQGALEINGKKYALSRNQIFVIPPNVENYSYRADWQNPWFYAWIAFNGTKAEYYMKRSGLDYERVTRPSGIPSDEFTAYIYDMLKASQLTIANELDRTASLYLILAKLIESAGSNGTYTHYDYSSETYVKYAIQYIQFNYNRGIQVNDIVDYIGIDRSWFSHVFKEKMGIPPQKYLQQCRMEHAKKLLVTTDDTVEAIAGKVGYRDPFTFSKIFKKLTGESPRSYRKSHT